MDNVSQFLVAGPRVREGRHRRVEGIEIEAKTVTVGVSCQIEEGTGG